MATVVNETKAKELGGAITEATSAWARFAGLMLRGGLEPGQGLIIRPCGSIHMMFMRFSIDAVFFDGTGVVTKVSRGLRPWVGIAFGGKGAKGVIELPAGAARGTDPGDQLRFQTD